MKRRLTALIGLSNDGILETNSVACTGPTGNQFFRMQDVSFDYHVHQHECHLLNALF